MQEHEQPIEGACWGNTGAADGHGPPHHPGPEPEWDAWRGQVERLHGRPITDGVTVDMLYALYLGDISPRLAAQQLGGLKHASVAVKRALGEIEHGMAPRNRARSGDGNVVFFGNECWDVNASAPIEAPAVLTRPRNIHQRYAKRSLRARLGDLAVVGVCAAVVIAALGALGLSLLDIFQ